MTNNIPETKVAAWIELIRRHKNFTNENEFYEISNATKLLFFRNYFFFCEFNRLPPLDKELFALRVLNHDWIEIRKMIIEFSVVSLFIQWQTGTLKYQRNDANTHTQKPLCFVPSTVSKRSSACVWVQVKGVLVCVCLSGEENKATDTHEYSTNTKASHTQVLFVGVCVRFYVGNCAYTSTVDVQCLRFRSTNGRIDIITIPTATWALSCGK